jgi:hypothetical protein
MQQMQAQSVEVMQTSMPMMDMDQDHQTDMSGMDCQKIDQSHASHNSLCKTGQDCVMYNVQLANPASNIIVFQPSPQYLNTQHYIAQSSEFVPTPDLFGLWRPPHAL